MSKYATKAANNVFYLARFNASQFNDRLSSRDGAAEELGIDRTRLARIELGSLQPYPEEVLIMADIYNAPELRNHFCREMCPLGSDMPRVDMGGLDRITVKALATLRKVSDTKDALLDITEDGIISDDEKPILSDILNVLEEVNEITANLKNWVKKNTKEV